MLKKKLTPEELQKQREELRQREQEARERLVQKDNQQRMERDRELKERLEEVDVLLMEDGHQGTQEERPLSGSTAC